MVKLAKLCKSHFLHEMFKGRDWKLNDTVREVVSSQYLPGKSKLENPLRPVLHQRLLDWESSLPSEMQFQPAMTREVMFLVGMLHMTYAYVTFIFPLVLIWNFGD